MRRVVRHSGRIERYAYGHCKRRTEGLLQADARCCAGPRVGAPASRRPEHVNSALTANLLRSIPERLGNDPQLGVFDDDVAFFRIAALLLLLRFRIENC